MHTGRGDSQAGRGESSGSAGGSRRACGGGSTRGAREVAYVSVAFDGELEAFVAEAKLASGVGQCFVNTVGFASVPMYAYEFCSGQESGSL